MKYTPIMLLTVFATLMLLRCANPKTPTGGPKDTIPPTLTTAIPAHKSINYKGQSMTFVFDEYINIDKLRNNLLITPLTTNKYETNHKKNRLTITFDDPLPDSTTYTFNFFDGVTDNTEKTPVEDFILAFSTGPFIDSLAVSGNIQDLYTQMPLEKFIIGLYPLSDTLDYLSNDPLYFTSSQKEGNFSLENIKSNTYKLFAYDDDNRNKRFDANEEAHAFFQDTIFLTDNYDSLLLNAQTIDLTPLEKNSARAFGLYFEIRYNKEITDYSIHKLDSNNQYQLHHQIHELKTLRFYNTANLTPNKDSLGLIVQVFDTLRDNITDTLYVKFNSSNKKPADFLYNIDKKTLTSVDKEYNAYISFNKPVIRTALDSLTLSFDSIYFLHPKNLSAKWNHNQTRIHLQVPINWQALNDTINLIKRSKDTTYQHKPINNISIDIPTGVFISAEKDSSASKQIRLTPYNAEDYGKIQIIIPNDSISYFLQLLNTNDDVVASQYNVHDYTFTHLTPGTYSIRILLDINNDQTWSIGNPLKNIPPEPVYNHPNKTELKANWEIVIEDISF